jgi:prepilin-type N-terminal cleavage/methylation domain-containing protein
MKKGFTLLELIVVIIIIGVLASLAVPQYFKVTERGRAAEGVGLLSLLRGSQIRYKAEKSAYATTVASLDADYTTTKYFTVNDPAGTAAEVAKVTRNATQQSYGAYVLIISEAGAISCSGGATGACAAIGY